MKLQVHGPAGVREAYAYTGGKAFDPALPCVVFIHGALNDHSVWTLLARWFAHHGFAVLAVDLPGHMRSAGPALASVEAMADWLLALLDAAGVQQAALVGHSMGSLVALQAAAQAPVPASVHASTRAPVRVSHLVMLGTCVPMPVPQALLDLSRTDPLAAIDRVIGFSFSNLAPKPSYPGPGVWLRGGYRALMRMVLAAQGDAGLFHTDFSACNAFAGGMDAAQKVGCPSHLVLGQFDQMTLPRGAREVAAVLKACVHTLPAGHALMQEVPDPVLAALHTALVDG